MGKKKYTQEQIDFVRNLVERGSEVTPAARKMCEHFNMEYSETVGRKMREKMQKLGVTNNVQTVEDTDVFKDAQNKQHDKTKKRFLISWAQAETKVHKKFLRNMEAYAKHIDGDILICAGRYKNPTSLSASKALKSKEKNLSLTWDKEVIPYLDANRHNLHKYLCVLSDVKVQPTASTPLTGLNSITGLESCIVGHPRVQLKSLPVVEGYPHKLLLTTGACTVENYTDTKIGKTSEFHHQLGFCLVELDDKDFHVRQIIADNKGDFYDLIFCVFDGKVGECGEGIPAIVFGDLHLQHHNEKVVETSLSLAKKLKANKIILHDVVDSFSISHHEKNNPFILLGREEDGSWNLEKELDYVVNWFREREEFNFIAVRSNHCEFIDRWLSGEDWRKTQNKKLYLKFANLTAQGKAKKGIVPYILETECSNVKALELDESHNVLGFELGIHGHVGASGSRGSANQFKSLPVKNVTGHTHTPLRLDGHLSVGTLTHLRVGYNKGMSSWLNSNVIIYPNGKASHIHIINNKYTTLF